MTRPDDLQTAYALVQRTIARWAHRTTAPRAGTLGAVIMAELRADLGPWVILPVAAPALPAPAERRSQPPRRVIPDRRHPQRT